MPCVVEHAHAFLLREFSAEGADCVEHFVPAGIELEVDLEAQLLQFIRNALGVIAWVLQWRFGVLAVADHERDARQHAQ